MKHRGAHLITALISRKLVWPAAALCCRLVSPRPSPGNSSGNLWTPGTASLGSEAPVCHLWRSGITPERGREARQTDLVTEFQDGRSVEQFVQVNQAKKCGVLNKNNSSFDCAIPINNTYLFQIFLPLVSVISHSSLNARGSSKMNVRFIIASDRRRSCKHLRVGALKLHLFWSWNDFISLLSLT